MTTWSFNLQLSSWRKSVKLDVAQTWPGRCSRCQLAGEMEPRVGHHSSLFCLAIVFIPCAAGSRGNDQMGRITLQLLINLSESRQLIMARKVHMNVVYVTGSGNSFVTHWSTSKHTGAQGGATRNVWRPRTPRATTHSTRRMLWSCSRTPSILRE